MLGGIAIAFSIAFPLGWIMLRYKIARQTLQPLFIIIQCIPMFTLAPIMVVCFGWSYTAIVIPTALMIFFPLTLNIYQGLRSTPKKFLDLFYLYRTNPWQTFIKLRLPWAFPQIFAGLRISGAIAGIGAVAGEWAGAESGLGMLMQESRRCTDLDTTFAAFFCLTIISLLFYGCIALLEHILLSPPKKPLPFLKKFSSFILFLMLCSCNSSPSSSKQTHLLLDWFPNPNHVPLYVGLEKGIFDNYGIHLKIQKIHDPSDAIPYLTSSQTDLALYYMPYTIKAKAQGAKIRVVGVLFKEPLDSLLFRKDSLITEVQDLNDKVLGYSLGGLNTAYITALTNELNVRPKASQNVHFDIISALASKRVDASFGAYWNIETEHLKSLGVETQYFKLSDLNIPNYYELVILSNDNFLKKNPHFARNFQKALQESISFSKQFPDDAFALYAQANPDKSPKTLSWEKKSWKLTYPLLAKDQEMDKSCWQVYSEWMYKHHLLDEAIEIQDLFL